MSALVALWGKGLIVVAVALALSYLPKLTAAARHLILLLALLGLPLLPVIAALTPVPITLTSSTSLLTFTPTFTILTRVSGQISTSAEQATWYPSLSLLGFMYAAVAVLILGYWLIQLRRTVNWLKRTSILHDPIFERTINRKRTSSHTTLRQASAMGSPLTWGVLRPCIVVPGDWHEWPISKRQTCLMHESSHINRYDTLTSSIGMLICCLFWINPLVWIAHRRMLHEAESACDDVVIRSGVSPTDYASQLLTIARSRSFNATAAMASVSLLSRRIEALLNNDTRRVPMNTIQSLVIVGLMTAIIIPISSLHAELDQQSAQSSSNEPRQVPEMRETTYNALAETQHLIEDGRPAEAIPILEEMKASGGLNSYEVAQIWNLLAYAYYSVDDTPNTIRAYEQVLAQGNDSITEALEMSSLRALFQLYYGEEEYNAALTNIDRWLKVRELPDPATIFLKANCYYQLDDFRSSLKYAKESEQVAIAQQEEVKEPWLYLQVVNYKALKDYDNVVRVLEKLIVLYPKQIHEDHLIDVTKRMESSG